MVSDRAEPLSVKDIAKHFRVTPATVAHWIRSGELQAVDVGRKPGSAKPRWRIARAALEAFELRRAASPAKPSPRARRKQPAGDVIEFFA